MRLTYTEYEYYNILEDEPTVRLSVFHDGQEFYALLAAEPKWRARRAQALEAIAEIATSCCDPGDYTAAVREALDEKQAEGVCE